MQINPTGPKEGMFSLETQWLLQCRHRAIWTGLNERVIKGS